MNFEESIHPLTEFLTNNNFSVTYKSPHFIKYSSNLVTITIAYANLEYLFYTHVGQNSASLMELTSIEIKEVFNDGSFQYQPTLSIDNLILFLKTSGESILSGDPNTFKKLNEFIERQSKEFIKQITHEQNVQGADRAWRQKDYMEFIKCIDSAERDLLAESYLKKYKIAVNKLKRQAE